MRGEREMVGEGGKVARYSTERRFEKLSERTVRGCAGRADRATVGVRASREDVFMDVERALDRYFKEKGQKLPRYAETCAERALRMQDEGGEE